jgi:mannose-6-phosphate isomerase-like protein (cupin superfamily)
MSDMEVFKRCGSGETFEQVPGVHRILMYGEKCMLTRVGGVTGLKFGPFRMTSEMVFYLESGRVLHVVDGEEFMLEAGDFHVIPAFSMFSGKVLEDCVAWEAIAPPRQDLAVKADGLEI